MGNKLCAPLLKKNYRSHDSNPWHNRKDSHLLRLWADVFRVHGDGEFMRWERVSDDVVPVNISCIEDTPTTVFHITAYNRQVEKIFDVKISQPGTIICPATECFVHWRDAGSQCEWGLNFSTATDAQRFRDCCSFPTQRFARKASSASSLRLSPPKRQRSKAASASSPSSPVRHSNPVTSQLRGEDGCEHTQGLTVISTSKNPNGRPNSSPSRDGAQNGGGGGGARCTQSPPPDYAVIHRRKPPSGSADDSSVAATSSSASSSAQPAAGGGGSNPAFRRSFPSGRANQSTSSASGPQVIPPATKMTYPPRGRGKPDSAKKGGGDGGGSGAASDGSTSSSATTPSKSNTHGGSGGRGSGATTPSRAGVLKGHVDPHVRPASAVSDLAQQKGSSPKHVVISDIVSVSISGVTSPSPPTVYNPNSDKLNGILKRDNSVRVDPVGFDQTDQKQVRGHFQTSFIAGDDSTTNTSCDSTKIPQILRASSGSPPPPRDPSPPPPPPPPPPEENAPSSSKGQKSTLTVDTSLTTPASRHTSSSESPEWPSPPEPLTPQTPQTPNAPGQMSFDSDTIQRMLRSLPSSPIAKDYDDEDMGFHEGTASSVDEHGQAKPGANGSSTANGRRGSKLSRTKSLNVHDRNSKPNNNPRRQQSVDSYNPANQPGGSAAGHRVDVPKPRMFNKIALEKELKQRNKNIAASYPDSGIGMSADTAPSLRSEGSAKSAFVKTGEYIMRQAF
ncbi:sialidase [Aplysia californica]|uniref:Sialidase n=1 Tax=Aplysia californica TaxID=6500 RepID=A0ABM1A9K2_APLCA|nr:sialidase [Aplysia californica]